MVNGTEIQLYDTGMEEKGGSVIYTRAHTDWVDCYAISLRPEINYVGTNYESKKLSGDLIDYVGNRIESKNPPRLNVVCRIPVSDLTSFQKILKMGDTLGLKKIQGGLGTLATMEFNHPTDSDIYCIITAIQCSETLKSATDNISVTISLQVV